MKPRRLPLLLVASALSVARAEPEGSLDFGGYLESLQSAAFADDLDSLASGNLLQNRLRLRWTPASQPSLFADLEMRNRLWYGEALRNQPGLRSSLGRDPGWLDLNLLPLDQAGAVLSTAIDRAWIQWDAARWRLSVGRQRLNWGMALAWNPNDLFNAYDVLDLDYPERPGSDAVRLQLFPPFGAQFDLAAKADGSRRGVGALRVGWNAWETDFQALGGWYHDRVVVGAGWAGNLVQAGFKGEASWFSPSTKSDNGTLAATLSLDYAPRDGSYLSASALFNGDATGGLERLLSPSGEASDRGPADLFPSTWTFLVQATHPLSLILTCGATVLWAPDLDVAMAIPSLDWNFAENWGLEARAQSVLSLDDPSSTGLRSLAYAGTLRLRRSF